MTAPRSRWLRDITARTRLALSALVGLVAGVAVGATPAGWQLGLLAGWMAGAALHVVWMWATIWPMSIKP